MEVVMDDTKELCDVNIHEIEVKKHGCSLNHDKDTDRYVLPKRRQPDK